MSAAAFFPKIPHCSNDLSLFSKSALSLRPKRMYRCTCGYSIHADIFRAAAWERRCDEIATVQSLARGPVSLLERSGARARPDARRAGAPAGLEILSLLRGDGAAR